MAAVEKQALAWRTQYDVDLENLAQQRTQVRAYVAALRNEAELQGADGDCKRRFNSKPGRRHKVKSERAWF